MWFLRWLEMPALLISRGCGVAADQVVVAFFWCSLAASCRPARCSRKIWLQPRRGADSPRELLPAACSQSPVSVLAAPAWGCPAPGLKGFPQTAAGLAPALASSLAFMFVI